MDPLLRCASRSCRSSSRWRRAIALVRRDRRDLARRGIASPLLTAAAWVVLEALRGRWPFGGFPWADVGVALHGVRRRARAGERRRRAARELRRGGGRRLPPRLGSSRSRAGRHRAVVLAGAGLVGLLAVGGHGRRHALRARDDRRAAPRGAPGRRRGAVRSPSNSSSSSPTTTSRSPSRLAGDYDLIIFPESALDTDPEIDAEAARRARRELGAEHDSALLVNARTAVDRDAPQTGDNYNTNLFYDPDGALQGEYSKQHLVPFGEYVPWRDQLGFISRAPPGALRLPRRRRDRGVRRERVIASGA